MDTFQVWRGDEEREQVIHEIREAGPNTQIVQVADSRVEPRSKENRLVPGKGVLPLPRCSAVSSQPAMTAGSRSRSCRPNYGRSTTTGY